MGAAKLLDYRREISTHVVTLAVIGWLCFAQAPTAAAQVPTTEPSETVTESETELTRHEFTQRHMGVDFKLVFYAPGSEAANRAAEAAFARVAELDAALSDYDPQSELSRLSATAGSDRWIRVSDDLWRVLSASKQLAARSEGAFDVTVGPVVRLWRRARRQGEFPVSSRLQEARAATGNQYLQLDESQQKVHLAAIGMRLDLGGIAKGFAADEALAILVSHGIERAIVDASGDMAIGAPPPNAPGWRVGIAPLEPDAPPSRHLLLTHVGVATSGDAWQYAEINGVRYSHIVDPRTGVGLTTRSSVTVIAPTAMAADSLASAVSVVGPAAGQRLIKTMPQCEVAIVWQADDDVQLTETPGLADLLE